MKLKRIIPDGIKPNGGITVRPIVYNKAGKDYTAYLVQGWAEGGKWQRRQFATEPAAEAFAAETAYNFGHTGRPVRCLSTTLSELQLAQAELAVLKLGDDYSINQAIDHFLLSHRDATFSIKVRIGISIYLDMLKLKGKLRPATMVSRRSALNQFAEAHKDAYVHEITAEVIEDFLGNLKGRDGLPAKLKTWNNYRGELKVFFQWAGEVSAKDHRPWVSRNPIDSVEHHSVADVAEQRDSIAVSTPEDTRDHFTMLMRDYPDAVAYFAVGYFAGLRPIEVQRISRNETQFDFAQRNINVTVQISKTKKQRIVDITSNLRLWLDWCGDVLPEYRERHIAKARAAMGLSYDECRHSFSSFHAAAFQSKGATAVQSGHSESVQDKHYCVQYDQDIGARFFSIVPCKETNTAIFAKSEPLAKALN